MASERVSVPPGDWLQGPPACDETKVKVVHDSVRTVMYRLARNPTGLSRAALWGKVFKTLVL